MLFLHWEMLNIYLAQNIQIAWSHCVKLTLECVEGSTQKF